jgi:drug/metabolite transporter (DMT)-like permease
MAASRSVSPYLLLTLTPFFWSCNWIVGRALASDIPPMAMTFLRWFFAILILAPFAIPHVRHDLPLLRLDRIYVRGFSVREWNATCAARREAVNYCSQHISLKL